MLRFCRLASHKKIISSPPIFWSWYRKSEFGNGLAFLFGTKFPLLVFPILVAELARGDALDLAEESGELTYTLEAERVGYFGDGLRLRDENLLRAVNQQSRDILCWRDARNAFERLTKPRITHSECLGDILSVE